MSLAARFLLLVPLADAVFVTGQLILTATRPLDGFVLGLIIYNLLSPAAMVGLVVLTVKKWPRGMPVTVVAVLLLTGFIAAAVLSVPTSSTGALAFLFLPIWVCIAALFGAGLVGVVHRHRADQRTVAT